MLGETTIICSMFYNQLLAERKGDHGSSGTGLSKNSMNREPAGCNPFEVMHQTIEMGVLP